MIILIFTILLMKCLGDMLWHSNTLMTSCYNYSTGEHPLSKLLAECQFNNVCESIKPWVVATAKGGNFPTMTVLPLFEFH